MRFACYATLRKVLRRARWRWRRTGKPPALHRVRAARKALAKLRAHEQAGRCDMFSGDESGFCLQPTLGRCWQPPGPTLSIPAQAHSRRWNGCGFLRGDGELSHLGRAGRLGAKEFIEAVETRLLPVLRRPSLLVLDNGPATARAWSKPNGPSGAPGACACFSCRPTARTSTASKHSGAWSNTTGCPPLPTRTLPPCERASPPSSTPSDSTTAFLSRRCLERSFDVVALRSG